MAERVRKLSDEERLALAPMTPAWIYMPESFLAPGAMGCQLEASGYLEFQRSPTGIWMARLTDAGDVALRREEMFV